MHRFLLTGLLIMPVSYAQVYEWIDEDGKRQFSDQPPPENIESEEKTYKIHNIDSNMPPPIVIDEGKKQREAQETAARSQHMDTQCKEARDYLKKLTGRVSFYDDDGNHVQVTEKERAARVRSLEELIRNKC